MATKLDVGGEVYQFAVGVATISFTPLFDRAALLRRVNLSNASARDTWDLTIGGRVVASFRDAAGGNNRVLRVDPNNPAPTPGYFAWVRDILGVDPSFPVPQGLTATLASRGGATADIDFEVLEVDPADVPATMLNHFAGRHFLIPIAWALVAGAAGAGPTQVDTQFAPSWLPALFSATPLPVNWEIKLLALFLEGMGVNTFSGAVNVQSTTQDVRIIKNGTLLFSRTTSGIPNRGRASAVGSANTVFGAQSGIFPPFEFAPFSQENLLSVPIRLHGGDNVQILQEFQGAFTGAPVYQDALITAIADVMVPSAAGSI